MNALIFPKKQFSSLATFVLLTIFAFVSQGANAIDVDPGDFVPAPGGTTVGLLYYQHAERSDLYSNGDRLPLNGGLTSNIGIARLVHYASVGGLIVAPQILVPFGKLEGNNDTSALGNTSGVGDIILAAPIFPINDAASRTYLGIAPYLFLPTGSYDESQSLNLGENRWKSNLQIGFVKGFTESWYIDLTGDAMFYGDNTGSGSTLKQAPQMQAQGYLRYQFNAGSNVSVGISQMWGGETKTNGVSNKDETRQLKASIGGSYFVGPKTQLMGAVGRDISVENGFKEKFRINLRILQIF